MTKIEDGGPAFPIETTATPWAPGMSLRDWFAGQALNASIAETGGLFENDAAFGKNVAKHAYAIADAMLAARKTGGE